MLLLLAERGIVVSCETVRRWCKKFGQTFSNRHRGTTGAWTMYSSGSRACNIIFGARSNQGGVVLDILVQPRRDGLVAKRFFRQLLKGLDYLPRLIVTDKLQSYGVARRQLLPKVEHRQSHYLNNSAENSHWPTRRRERQMQRFKSAKQARDFLSTPPSVGWKFLPRNSDRVSQRMAAGDMRAAGCVTGTTYPHVACGRPIEVNVTMPGGHRCACSGETAAHAPTSESRYPGASDSMVKREKTMIPSTPSDRAKPAVCLLIYRAIPKLREQSAGDAHRIRVLSARAP